MRAPGPTPLHCGDDTINALIDLESRPNPNAGKQAIRYGRDILMMADRKIERWPTENRASERLGELTDAGYFVAVSRRGSAITFREWEHCGPAQTCGVEHVRIGLTSTDPGESVALPYSDPDSCDEVTL